MNQLLMGRSVDTSFRQRNSVNGAAICVDGLCHVLTALATFSFTYLQTSYMLCSLAVNVGCSWYSLSWLAVVEGWVT